MGCGSPAKHQITIPTLETPLKPPSQGTTSSLHIPLLPLKEVLGLTEPLPQQLLPSASIEPSSSSVFSGDFEWKQAGIEDEHRILPSSKQWESKGTTHSPSHGELPEAKD